MIPTNPHHEPREIRKEYASLTRGDSGDPNDAFGQGITAWTKTPTTKAANFKASTIHPAPW